MPEEERHDFSRQELRGTQSVGIQRPRVVASVRALSPGLAYAPASGVGHYRQAAPLGADVKKVVMEVEEKEERGELVDQDILTAENVALDGAERSLLTKVRSQMVLSKG